LLGIAQLLRNLMESGLFQRDRDSSLRLFAFGQGVLGCAKIAAQDQKDRPLFLNRVFRLAMKRAIGAGGERMKIDRRMARPIGTDRFIEVLFEVASTGTEDAQAKIVCVSRRHPIVRPTDLGAELPLSTTHLRPLRPSDRPEAHAGPPPGFLPTPAGLGLRAKLVSRLHRLLPGRQVQFERRCAFRLTENCRSFAAVVRPQPLARPRFEFSRSLSPNYTDRFPLSALDSSERSASLRLNRQQAGRAERRILVAVRQRRFAAAPHREYCTARSEFASMSQFPCRSSAFELNRRSRF